MNPCELRIDPTTYRKEINDQYGIFFEDLNHAADGGLYGELVQNRAFSFESVDNMDYHPLTAWESIGSATLHVSTENPLNLHNPNSLLITTKHPREGVKNIGYNGGISFEKGTHYRFSCYAKGRTPLLVQLENLGGRSFGEITITPTATQEWTKYEGTIVPRETLRNGRLALRLLTPGEISLTFVSLFPPTFMDRPNGMRRDLAQKLAELTPRFLRFPGGCLVHDGTVNADDRNSMYRWKTTVGPVEERPPRRNNWNYQQSYGLGFYEYFQFSEDIGATPLPVIPGGYDPHHHRIVPMEEMGPWVQDALDLIEFANGETSTPWGKLRGEMGHPEPFHLRYLAIGNEEVGEPFFQRFPLFYHAIKEKYPEIQVIGTSGPFAAGGEYDRGWQQARALDIDYVDEHYYQTPQWFLANTDRYKAFDPQEPKVFLGEYATGGNRYFNALAEAAFMTGLDNAPAVGLACYAPLFANVDYVSWQPNLIWFDHYRVYGTPNYYVQKLFMNHQGDFLVATEATGLTAEPTPEPAITGGISLMVDHTAVRFTDIVLTDNTTGTQKVLDDQHLTSPTTLPIAQSPSAHYVLELTAEITQRDRSRFTGGNYGFSIGFGWQDSHNHLRWEVGGWQNQDLAVFSAVDDFASCLTQHLFTTEVGIPYRLRLEIKGRSIQGSIDGVLISEAYDKLPTLQPLYYSAVVEKSGDLIVKGVNLQEKITVSLALGQRYRWVTTYALLGYDREQENSLDSPQTIQIQEQRDSLGKDHLSYTFPKDSVTVLRFSNRPSNHP